MLKERNELMMAKNDLKKSIECAKINEEVVSKASFSTNWKIFTNPISILAQETNRGAEEEDTQTKRTSKRFVPKRIQAKRRNSEDPGRLSENWNDFDDSSRRDQFT